MGCERPVIAAVSSFSSFNLDSLMADAPIAQCPVCGRRITGDTPMGLCASCVLAVGLSEEEHGPNDGNTGGIQEPKSRRKPGSSGLSVRCPQCGRLIELATGAPLSDIHCDSCGANFDVVDQSAATQSAAALGRIEQFQVLEQLGAGAFGTVWKARDLRLDRLVAIKIPRRGHLDPAEAEKFLREARAAAQLQHPNIVSIHEVGREADLIYIVCEYVEGVSLADRLAGQRMSPREAAGLCSKLARALHHAHESGIVHRDIKPQNILIDRMGEPHLTDFGLARRELGEVTLTMDGQLLGTPAYMSPEQARGEAHAAQRQTDIYSLGVVLFQLLTGELPFRGNSRMLLQQVIHEEPLSPRKLNGHVPRDLETITLKCLEKVPGKRFVDTAELADELDRFVEGKAILARPVSGAERLWRWCRRKPLIAGLGVAVLMLLSTVAVVSTVAAVRVAASRASEWRESHYRYYRSVQVAQGQIQQGDVDLARETLLECPKELRHWEWGHLMLLCHQDIAQLKGHTSNITQLRFSPNSKLLASLDADGLLHVWDWLEGKAVFSHTNASNRAVSAVWISQGRQLLVGTSEGEIQVWDTVSWTQATMLSVEGEGLVSLAYNEAGSPLLAVLTDGGGVEVWDLTSRSKLHSFEPELGIPTNVQFNQKGTRLILKRKDQGEVRDMESGEVSTVIRTDGARCLVVGPDADCWVVIDQENRVHLWRGGQLVRRFHRISGSQPGQVNQAFFSPDGRLVCHGGDQGTAAVWNAKTGEREFPIATQVHGGKFSVDGERLVVWGEPNVARILDARTGREVLTMHTQPYRLSCATFTSDRRFAAYADIDGGIRVRLADLSREVLPGRTWVWGATYSPDGKRIAMAPWSEGLVICDADSGQRLMRFRSPVEAVVTTAFSPDGKWVVTGGTHHEAKIWDIEQAGLVHTLRGHTRPVNGVAFDPSGCLIATVSGDGDGRLWDAQTGENVRILKGHKGPVVDLAFSHGGDRLATVGTDGTAKTWDVKTGDVLREFVGHTDYVRDVLFTPDDGHLVTASRDRTVRVWDAASGQCLSAITCRAQVGRIALSADGRRLAAATTEEFVFGFGAPGIDLWDFDVERRWFRLIVELTGHREPVSSMALRQSDGLRLVTGFIDDYARQWEALPWDQFTQADASSAGTNQLQRLIDRYWRERLTAEALDVGSSSAERVVRVPLDPALIPVRDERFDAQQIDLSPHFTGALHLHFYPVYIGLQSRNHLGTLPQGTVEFGGVLFDVRGVIQLRGMHPSGGIWTMPWGDLPERVEGIELRRRPLRVHLLHGTVGQEPDNTTLAKLVWNYSDGQQRESLIVYGSDVRDWWFRPGQPSEVSRGRVAWTGRNPVADGNGATLRLYRTSYDNSRPGVEVESLDYISFVTRSAPFLIALTTE